MLLPLPASRVPAPTALETLRSLPALQAKEAPALVLKVKVTGPGATNACEPMGMATVAPGVVLTVPGKLRLVEPVAAVGPNCPNRICVETVDPVAFDTVS